MNTVESSFGEATLFTENIYVQCRSASSSTSNEKGSLRGPSTTIRSGKNPGACCAQILNSLRASPCEFSGMGLRISKNTSLMEMDQTCLSLNQISAAHSST